jgi:DNA-binding CsgD family transcriptional regulator
MADILPTTTEKSILPGIFDGAQPLTSVGKDIPLDREILNNVPALIHIRDQQTGAILWCNAAWERLLNLPSEQIVARSSEILKNMIHPDDAHLLRLSNEYYQNKNMQHFGGVIRARFPEGQGWHWMVGISSVIRTDAGGVPLETLAVFLDFTEIIHTESQIREALRDALSWRYSDILSKITKRERQVIRLLVKGLNNEQIAGKLFISHHTVESHRKNIRIKLNVKNTSELISLVKDIGI